MSTMAEYVDQSPARPWERQPGESPKAFQAFATYRDLGPGRTIDAAYCTAKGLPPGSRRAARRWFTWSVQHRWVERVAAWDAEQDRLRRERAAKELEEMHERHAAMAKAFIAKVVERIKTLDAAALTPRDMATWFDLAVRVERVARGVPGEHIQQQVTGPGGGAVQQEHRHEFSFSLAEFQHEFTKLFTGSSEPGAGEGDGTE